MDTLKVDSAKYPKKIQLMPLLSNCQLKSFLKGDVTVYYIILLVKIINDLKTLLMILFFMERFRSLIIRLVTLISL